MKKWFFLSFSLFLLACQPSTKKETEVAYQIPAHHVDELTRVFEAHGGYEVWDKMYSLSYQKGEEFTQTDLKNRKIRLESSNRTIGFDGENVWVVPGSIDASRARFYHNLYFYFYAMPFVVGDPGAFYEALEPRELAGQVYNQLKISFGDNVGDAPDDSYILLSDPVSNQMKWLMYTVTYGKGGPNQKYSLIGYENWTDASGLLLPTSLKWYSFENDSVGAAKSEVVFDNIKITGNKMDQSLFEMPASAQIAPK